MLNFKNDARALDHGTLEALRLRAVRQVVENNESPEVVVKALGFHRSAIYKWLSAFEFGGYEALKARKLFGRPSILAKSQLKWIYNTVANKNPLQLNFEFALWTREIIRDAIQSKFKIKLSLPTIGRVMNKLGFTVQKPLHRAFQQNQILVSKWLQEDFPEIQKSARKHGAEIYFEDEAGVRSDHHSGTTWSQRGKTPIVRTTGARFGLNLISAVSAKGAMRFMTFTGRFNGEVFIDFLQRLIHNKKEIIFLILDGHPVHKAAKVKRFVESTKGQLQLFYLPPYSPELNPDELVWNNLKNKLGRSLIKGPDDLKEKVYKIMKTIQANIDLVAAFFNEPNLRYAL